MLPAAAACPVCDAAKTAATLTALLKTWREKHRCFHALAAEHGTPIAIDRFPKRLLQRNDKGKHCVITPADAVAAVASVIRDEAEVQEQGSAWCASVLSMCRDGRSACKHAAVTNMRASFLSDKNRHLTSVLHLFAKRLPSKFGLFEHTIMCYTFEGIIQQLAMRSNAEALELVALFDAHKDAVFGGKESVGKDPLRKAFPTNHNSVFFAKCLKAVFPGGVCAPARCIVVGAAKRKRAEPVSSPEVLTTRLGEELAKRGLLDVVFDDKLERITSHYILYEDPKRVSIKTLDAGVLEHDELAKRVMYDLGDRRNTIAVGCLLHAGTHAEVRLVSLHHSWFTKNPEQRHQVRFTAWEFSFRL